ncbi:hypothetical protein MYX84_15530 [Acidobacteria bacterium AH-259-O06]|nr:hypothetical protein [Acidobacteria bacterium AH-259-O06]
MSSKASNRMTGYGRTLGALVEQSKRLEQVHKAELDRGDWVVVTTHNSVYSIHVLEDGFYSVSGGWFDRKGLSPLKTTITGCTWGGSAVKLDIIAACGLCLEFGNRVVTSRIRKIHLIPFRGELVTN